ncbi:hypothetical protein BC834DRAFT_349883 [Gloeopeniophorella convolvens]|nr:hypothetical protein BC834DRAFT_349883 [Gloeopeniophorella convolvens]
MQYHCVCYKDALVKRQRCGTGGRSQTRFDHDPLESLTRLIYLHDLSYSVFSAFCLSLMVPPAPGLLSTMYKARGFCEGIGEPRTPTAARAAYPTHAVGSFSAGLILGSLTFATRPRKCGSHRSDSGGSIFPVTLEGRSGSH